MDDITVVVVPCIIGAILVTCAFTFKRRKMKSGHGSSSEINVPIPVMKPTDRGGSEPFYANVDDLKPDPVLPSPSGGKVSRTNTKRKKDTSDTDPNLQGIVSDRCSIDSSEDGRSGHQSQQSICPSGLYCNTPYITPDTAIYSNCTVERTPGSPRLIQADHYTYLDTVHSTMEATPTLQAQWDMYVNTKALAQGGSTASAQPDHYTYLDPLPGSSTLNVQSESDEYDLPYAFTRNRNVPVPKHDHYLNTSPAKKEKKRKKKKSNKKR